MTDEHPLGIGLGSSQGDALSTARGILRDGLGALRNLAELLRSPRVAPKSLSSVLPDVLEAFTPMRGALARLIDALGEAPPMAPGRSALEGFVLPRLALLEAAVREAAAKPMSAATRLKLECAVGESACELDAARELLTLLERSASARSVSVNPTELVREAFASPPSSRATEQEGICVVMSSRADGLEMDTDPRVAMTLVALGAELVSRTAGPGEPTLWIRADSRGGCRIEVARRPPATGEPLVLIPRGVIDPTLVCLQTAARLSGGTLDFSEKKGAFSLGYPLSGATQRDRTA
jgi:hypothetical protein